jgi:hypothetical protein
MRHLLLCLLLLAMPWPATEASASQRQNRPEIRSGVLYRMNFTLHVFEGSQDRKREFVMTVGEGREGRVRALTRVPVRQGTQMTYMETGVKCDAEYQETEGGIQLEVELVFSEVATETVDSDLPLIHEWQSQIQKVVPPNQATVLSTYNDEQRNRKYELVVTAEKLQ